MRVFKDEYMFFEMLFRCASFGFGCGVVNKWVVLGTILVGLLTDGGEGMRDGMHVARGGYAMQEG